MARDQKFYCPVCDGEMWPTRDGCYFLCPDHTKLIPHSICKALHSMSRATLEEFRIRSEQAAKQRDELRERIKTLPVATLVVDKGRQSIWKVEGQEGYFTVAKDGQIAALDLRKRIHSKRLILSLKPLSAEAAARRIFGR